MEKLQDITGKLWFKALIIIVILVAAFSVKQYLEKEYTKKSQVNSGSVTFYDSESGESSPGLELHNATQVSDDHKILQVFRNTFPDTTVLLACEEDLTNDGCKDLVVIYNTPYADEHSEHTDKVNDGYIRLTVLIDSGDGVNYTCTAPIPAPVEKQKIEFNNVDKKDEIEFILQGQKGAKVGYAIYRVIDGAPVNMFGEGMEEC